MKRGELISESYRRFVRMQRCRVCDREGAEAHHEPSRGVSGLVMDLDLVPLCTRCHMARHAKRTMAAELHTGVLVTLRSFVEIATPEQVNAFVEDRNAWWERKQVVVW